jgi:isopentenyl diphosphate isomerase/L-lactate dehydrogenase-like FMN-dependent dehydrogenase
MEFSRRAASWSEITDIKIHSLRETAEQDTDTNVFACTINLPSYIAPSVFNEGAPDN